MKHPLPSTLGFGLGLRARHINHVLETKPAIDWFEIISENYMDTGGKPRRNIERTRADYPVVMHGVGMSIGTVDPLDSAYLKKLKDFADWLQPAWISDHLCWTGVAHRQVHDLLPVPYTEEALQHIVDRIHAVQDYLGRPIALENPSTYLEFKSSTMPEAEFIARMAAESGCHLLLDVNNVYVTCYNHRLDPKAYLDALPLERVVQIHLSGHTNKGTHIVDTHDDHVVDEVWELYKYVVNKAARVPNTMVEWDGKIPEFAVLSAELDKARAAAKDAANYMLPQLAAPAADNDKTNQLLESEQRRMQEAILSGSDSRPDIWIRTKAGFAPEKQLQVYINAYRQRLFDVTAEDYTALEYYLGHKRFEELMDGFVESTLSDNFNIARYAAKFPDFVQQKLPTDVFAQELCRFEAAITQLADKAETEPLTGVHLAGVTPEKLMETKLMPRAALQLFEFSYPVNNYYRQFRNDEAPATPEPRGSFVAVYRHEDSMWRLDLEKPEHELLLRLFSGQTIGTALDNVSVDEDAVSAWFSRWMQNGLLAAEGFMQSQKKNAA